MSVLGRFRRSGKDIPANATFRLTQEGRERLVQRFGSDPKSRVLVALETGGTMDVGEIAKASGLSKGQVERLVPVLTRGGYIQYVSASIMEAGD